MITSGFAAHVKVKCMASIKGSVEKRQTDGSGLSSRISREAVKPRDGLLQMNYAYCNLGSNHENNTNKNDKADDDLE